MRSNVQRWGNSLALRIPSALATEADLQEGVAVEIAARGGKLVVERAARRFVLADLLAGINDDNMHGEAWGDVPRGKETW